MTPFAERFQGYFSRDVAVKAASSISDGSEIQFEVTGPDGTEAFYFTKAGGKNTVQPGKGRDPQVGFVLTPLAAEQILADPASEVGTIGIGIARLILSTDANRKVNIRLHTGFITLFTRGYFGVVTSGGKEFAAFLATKGLDGIAAIKAALKKLKS